MRPLIGVVAHTDPNRHNLPATSVALTYTTAIEKGGGVPLILPFTRDPDLLPAMLQPVGGLLIPGGKDIDPACYRQPPAAGLGEVDRELDRFQIAAFDLAMKRRLPVLAICRGAQLVNVALGGTLIQDIPSQIPDSALNHSQKVLSYGTDHPVHISPGSRLHLLFGPDIPVNSRHHQAIREPGRDLVITARAPDGVIEGAEHTSLPIDLVQWHPELMLWQDDAMLPLFRYFVDQCRRA